MEHINDNNNEAAPQSEGDNKLKFVGFRATPEELARIDGLKAACGLNRSEYLRQVATGHKPRHRLTAEELSAIDTLEGCRKQAQQFLNRVEGMTDAQRKYLFSNPAYYQQWKGYVEAVIVEWTNMRKDLKKKG